MNKFLLILSYLTLGLLIFSNSYSQDQSEPKYLIDLSETKLTGFGNTHAEASIVDGNLAYTSGIAGAFLFNYQFYAGIYSINLESRHMREGIYPADHDPVSNPLAPITCNRIRFNHGGLMLGYIHNPNKLWHLSSNIKIGSGRIALYDKDLDFSAFDEYYRDWVAVITPEIGFEVNLARWCKFGASAGYRFVMAVNDDTFLDAQGEAHRLFKSSQFSSPVASIKFHFGSFGPRKNEKNGTSANNRF
jgi:hypothetical protein